LIDVDRGLYEPIGIQEVPAFHSKKKRHVAVFFAFSSSIFLCFEKKGKSIGVLVG
jgi:hypothetical protein